MRGPTNIGTTTTTMLSQETRHNHQSHTKDETAATPEADVLGGGCKRKWWIKGITDNAGNDGNKHGRNKHGGGLDERR